jgi:TolB-like protein/predicted Zn-dependent protease
VDARSDVFSLGVLLYELLDGQAPFDGATPSDVLVAILQHEPPPLTLVRPEVGADLAHVIATCLAKDPQRRYASGKALAEALEALNDKQKPAATGPPSIAVLPFRNLSPDADNEYFCDGIAEDLMNGLTKIRELRVAARMSSFAFKHRQADVREIGRLLNVRTVLEGSVRKAGDRLRVTVELVNVADGFQIWSERYDRALADVFAIQDEISTAIVMALKGTLLGEERAALSKHRTDNIEAFEMYARGRHHWQTWTAEGLAQAKDCMEQAIALDPKYALAYVGLADCLLATQAAGFAPPRAVLPRARIELSRALGLDPNLDMAWALLGIAHFSCWDSAPAHGAIARALELNPFLAHAHSARGSTFWFQGQMAAAAEAAARSVELEPLAPVFRYLLTLPLMALGDFDGAATHARFMLENDKNNWQAHYVLGLVQYARGQHAAAAESFEAAARLSGGSATARGALVCALASAGQRARAEQEYEALLATKADHYVSGTNVAAACVGLDDVNAAFEYLEQAMDDMDTWVVTAWWNPLFADLRDDPRMHDILRRVGLYEAVVGQ